jgi:ankyrin repeat protein
LNHNIVILCFIKEGNAIMHGYSFILLVVLAAIINLTTITLASPSSATVGSIFDGVAADDEQMIRSIVAKDPTMLEAVAGGEQTPLIRAVLSGKLTAVKTLLDLGADTSAVEKDGYNVLHAAGFQGRAEILKVLLEEQRGLDPMVMHQDGYYPMHRACWGREARHTDTVRVFLEHGVSPTLESSKGKICADMTTNEETKKLLLERQGESSEL